MRSDVFMRIPRPNGGPSNTYLRMTKTQFDSSWRRWGFADAAYDSKGRLLRDDPDTDDPLEWLKARLDPADYRQYIRLLLQGANGEADLDHIPLDERPRRKAKDNLRSGILPSARTAQDALPSRAAERDFLRRFPSSVQPKQVIGWR